MQITDTKSHIAALAAKKGDYSYNMAREWLTKDGKVYKERNLNLDMRINKGNNDAWKKSDYP
eukprot:6652932-Prymnesium_polylepis.1